MIKRLRKVALVVLSALRNWWRPISQAGLAAGVWVNLVYLPLRNGAWPDLVGAGAFVAAVAGAYGVREWGKIKSATE